MNDLIPISSALTTGFEGRKGREYKVYSVEDLLALDENEGRWVIKDMIPWPGRVVIYGHGGANKSTMMFDASVAVASGGMLLNHWPVSKTGPVLIITTEGSKLAFADRVKALLRTRDIHPSRVQLYYAPKRIPVHEPAGYKLLLNICQRLQPVMVVLDPFVSFFSGDENSTKDVAHFVNCLDDLIADYPCTVVVIHHSRRDGEIRGSTVIWGWCDAAIELIKKDGVKMVGVPKPVTTMKAVAKKQRDGREGTLFTAVPFRDEELGMLSFGIYDGVDPRGVAKVWLMMAIYKVLKNSGQCFVQNDLTKYFKVGAARIQDALMSLKQGGFVNDDARLERSTSTDGSRRRTVKAWRAVIRISKVDAATAILRAIKEESIAAESAELY